MPIKAPNSAPPAQVPSWKSLKCSSRPAKEAVVEAPKEAGDYHLSIHISSTSVVGCDTSTPLTFTVEADDCPSLE